jgi:hypothetical protein
LVAGSAGRHVAIVSTSCRANATTAGLRTGADDVLDRDSLVVIGEQVGQDPADPAQRDVDRGQDRGLGACLNL